MLAKERMPEIFQYKQSCLILLLLKGHIFSSVEYV